MNDGWRQLLAGAPWYRGPGRFPISAYSEFMPAPWLGVKPYGDADPFLRAPEDNWGWNVNEYEQAQELNPGLEVIAREVLEEVVKLGRGQAAPQISRRKLQGNPYWPAELAARAGRLKHERYVILLALALARTEDDKGRVRWTLFGSSEQGPARAFWRSFYASPGQELPAAGAHDFLRRLLREAYRVADKDSTDLARAGLRVLPAGADEAFPFWDDEPLPSWCETLRWREQAGLKGVRFLLTFRPFARLPALIQNAYLAGELHLLPFPGSLVFWGARRYRELERELPLALQVPLLHLFPRYNDPYGIRIPQAGWIQEKRGLAAAQAHTAQARTAEAHTPRRQRVERTHRWQAVRRDQDDTALAHETDRVSRVLFSAEASHIGLYGKPMARNAQLWTHDYRALLDGPRAGRADLEQAKRAVEQGGEFGYRFVFPAMRVGPWEVYWQRPLVAFPTRDPQAPRVLSEAPAGFLTAYRASAPQLESPVELWPRLLSREAARASIELFAHEKQPRRYATTYNVGNLFGVHTLLGEALPRSFARNLIAAPKRLTFNDWLAGLPARASDAARARRLVEQIENTLAQDSNPPRSGEDSHRGAADHYGPLTFAHTAQRAFEVRYWKTIAALAHGRFRNKDNADCVADRATQRALRHRRRDLEKLGDYLLRHYERSIARSGLAGRAWAGEHAFTWRTDFDFPWMGGWARNQDGRGYERNLLVRIPGRDSGRAVIMADHYDTAYMHDHFEEKLGGTGARLAAAGADDNHSATAALMLAAPIFLELSKADRLDCDIWLVHLTGEEFPSDCMGARHLCQAIVEGTLTARTAAGKVQDLSKVHVDGVFVSDMIAHNNERDRDVFQISPGEGAASARLALLAHEANELWNAHARAGNEQPSRRGLGPGKRRFRGSQPPALAESAVLRGEIRPEWDPRSTLFNTDGQIFSDAGVPVVLFMEDYDINRLGYHDSLDTLANIDLDYGAALAAIVIETVARAASRQR